MSTCLSVAILETLNELVHLEFLTDVEFTAKRYFFIENLTFATAFFYLQIKKKLYNSVLTPKSWTN